MKLIATFKKSRADGGQLVLEHGGINIATWECLGKADNFKAAEHGNLIRDPTKTFGDTPTGTWAVTKGSPQRDPDTYGKGPIYRLRALSGQAKLACGKPNYRSGIWLHGGKSKPNGALRPTYGCIRVTDETISELSRFEETYGPVTEMETKEETNETAIVS